MYNKPGCEGISEKFPEHKVISTFSGEDSIEEIAACLDDLELVLTDGQLSGKMKGWNLAEELRKMGYKGHIVYIGASSIPDGVDPDLFTGFFPKRVGTFRDLKKDFASIAQYYLE